MNGHGGEDDFSISELRNKRREQGDPAASSPPPPPPPTSAPALWRSPSRTWSPALPVERPGVAPAAAEPPPSQPPGRLKLDRQRAFLALARRREWLVLGFLIGTVVAGVWAFPRWATTHEATVRLTRKELVFPPTTPGEAESPKPEPLAEGLVDRLLAALVPPVVSDPGTNASSARRSAPPGVARQLQRTATEETLALQVGSPEGVPQAVALANHYGSNLLLQLQALTRADAGRVADYLQQRLDASVTQTATARQELQEFTRETRIYDVEKESEAYLKQLSDLELKYESARVDLETLELRTAPPEVYADRLAAAQVELDTLLARYTEAHPAVMDQRQKVALLQKQMGLTGPPADPAAPGAPTLDPTRAAQRQSLTRQLDRLNGLRTNLQTRLAGLSENAAKFATLKSTLQRLEAQRSVLQARLQENRLLLARGAGTGFILEPATARDVRTHSRWPRILGALAAGGLLGLLCSAGLALGLEATDKRLKTAADVQRVTGLPVLATLGDLEPMPEAARAQWAFRTWTILAGRLGTASNQGVICGVLSARPQEGRTTWLDLLAKAAEQRGLRVLLVAADDLARPVRGADAATGAAQAATVSDYSNQVTQQLRTPGAPPVVRFALPGWLWNPARRKEWQATLAQWRAIENLVILVEMPPATQPESVLLAESLPAVLWLVGSGRPEARETQQHLETLRHARCNLIGAVLNREPGLTA